MGSVRVPIRYGQLFPGDGFYMNETDTQVWKKSTYAACKWDKPYSYQVISTDQIVYIGWPTG